MSTFEDIVNLSYDEFGRDNTAPLLILHGFFASSRNWRKIGEQLAENYHVFVPDMRNHGVSPHHPVMDYPAMAADVLGFMAEHNLPFVNLLGHSMGGKIAMWLALNYPEKVNKLIVVDIAPKPYAHGFDHIIRTLMDLPLAGLKNRKEAEILLAEAIPQLEYRQFLLQNLVLIDGKYQWRIDLAIYAKTAGNIAGFPETDKVSPFSGETLFLAGEESNYVNPGDFADLFPHGQFTVVHGAGHWLHVQKPEVFLEEVEKFL